MNITHRETRQGSFIPPFYYGYSYRRYDRMVDVWHVIPLNYLIRWWRNIKYLWDTIRGNPSWLDTQIMLAEKRTREQILKQLDKHMEKALNKIAKEKLSEH